MRRLALAVFVAALPAWPLAMPAALAAAPPVSAPALPQLSVQAATPELAAHVREIVAEAGPKLGAWLGAAPPRVRVVVAADEADFLQKVRAVGGPEWAAGLALTAEGLILLRPPRLLIDPKQFRLVLIHELVHLYLAAALPRREHPLWLEEGLAMYAAGEGGLERAAAMTQGLLGSGLIPFERLEKDYPESRAQVDLAYAQSYYFVSWLLNRHGPEVLRRVVASLVRGRELTQAFYEATGQGLAALEAEFGQEMTTRFSWLVVLTAGGTLWAGVSLVAGVGLVLRRRAHRRRMAAMADLEPMGGVADLRRLRRGRPRPGAQGGQAGPAAADADEPPGRG
ncbi:MAG: peptidase MA family metallohydrolase [Thermodesulfobacteriota bacterium]